MHSMFKYEEVNGFLDNERYVLLTDDETNEQFVVTAADFESDFCVCEDCDFAFRELDMTDEEERFHRDTGDCCCQNCIDNYEDNVGEYNYFYCRGHDRWESCYRDEPIYVNGVGYVCETYFDYNCSYCEGCDEYYLTEDGSFDENDTFYCDTCRYDRGYGDFEENYDGEYHNVLCSYHSSAHYSAKREFINEFNHKEELGCGFELEVHKPNSYVTSDDVEAVDEYLNGYAVYEEDCSINPGFEIITRPASFDEHMKWFPEVEKACKKLISLGYNSHNSNKCGLHVHLDRKYFGDSNAKQELAEAKILYLFLRHWDNMVRFSRRKNFTYCKKTKSDYDTTTLKDIVKGNCDSDMARGHYTAINISGSNTIEIRLWRGTLNPLSLKATLLFTKRIAELVKTTNISHLAKMEWEEILGDDPDILAYWETVKDRPLPYDTNDED